MSKGKIYTIAGITVVAIVSSIWAYYKFSAKPSDPEPDEAKTETDEQKE